MLSILVGVLEQGFIYAIMGLGVYITYVILDFPDLSVDGSFPFGAAVTTYLLIKGVNPYLTLLIAMVAGALAGVITGLIHVKLKVRDLLSGIIVMTALYTINLMIVGNQANVPLYSYQTIFENDLINRIIPESLAPYRTVIIVAIITIICKLLLDLYFRTKSGYLLRAVGDNDTLVTSIGKDGGLVKIVGLSLSNGLVALAGSVMCQQTRVFDITSGTGTLVIGLASTIIGVNVFKRAKLLNDTTATIIGSIIYKGCVAIALYKLSPQSVKLVTAMLFLLILTVKFDRKKKVKVNA